MTVLESLDRALEEIDTVAAAEHYPEPDDIARIKGHVIAAKEAAKADAEHLGDLIVNAHGEGQESAMKDLYAAEARVKVLEADRDSQQRVAMAAMERVKVLERALEILRDVLPIRPGDCPDPQPAKCNPLDGCGPCYVAEAIRRAEEEP